MSETTKDRAGQDKRPARRSAIRAVAAVAAAACLCLAAAAFLVFMTLGRGGMSLSAIAPLMERSLAESFGEGRVVRIGEATLARGEAGGFVVAATNVAVLDSEGRTLATLPRVGLGLEGLTLSGRPAVRHVEVAGASVHLKLGEDGQIAVVSASVDAAAPPPASSAAPPTVGSPDGAESPGNPPELTPFRRLGIWLDLIETSGLDGHTLTGVSLRNGAVTVDDLRSGRRFVFAGVDFDLSAPHGGGLAMSVSSSGSGARWRSTARITPRDAAGRRTIELDVGDLAFRDLSLAVQHQPMVHMEAPITGRLVAVLDPSGDPVSFSGRIALGSGDVGSLADASDRVRLDGAEAKVAWTAGSGALVVEQLTLASGANRFRATGALHPPRKPGEAAEIEVTTASITSAFLNPQSALATADLRDARFVYRPETRTLDIERLTLEHEGRAVLDARGAVTFGGRSPAIRMEMSARNMPSGLALALWPRQTSVWAYDWIARNVRATEIEEGAVFIDVPANVVADLTPLDPGQLLVRGRIKGVSVEALPGLPHVREGDVTLTVDGQATRVWINRGVVEPAPGRTLVVSNGVFEVLEQRVPRPRAQVRFRIDGSAAGAFDLLAREPLRAAMPGGVAPSGNIRGTVSAQVRVGFPIIERVERSHIDYQVDADLAGFAADSAVGDMKIEGGTVKVSASARDFAIRGEGKLAGAPATFDFRRASPTARPEIRLAATLDDAARARFGIGTGARIRGPTAVRVTTSMGDAPRYVVEADLTQAALADLVPGWVKPRGQPARGRFVASETDSGWRLDDILVEGRGVVVRGSATIDESGALETGTFPAYNLTDGDRVNVRLEKAGAGHRVIVRGETIDARSILRALTDPPRPGGPGSPQGDVEIDVRVGAAVGGNGEVVRQVDMKMARRGAEIRAMTATGRVGRNAPLAVELRGQGAAQRLVVSAGDAGAFFRFLDLYGALQGGDLALVMTPIQPDGSIREGTVEITNFAIRGDPAVSGLIAQAGEGAPRRARSPGADMSAFSRLRTDFNRNQSRVNLANGLLWGVAIGATVEGEFDLARDQVRLTGTYVPAYALNNILARIPVFGYVLGGAPDEGVFGVTYRIAGSVTAPNLTINPLSAVAPGFLRKIFEFRGGARVRPDEAAAR